MSLLRLPPEIAGLKLVRSAIVVLGRSLHVTITLIVSWPTLLQGESAL